MSPYPNAKPYPQTVLGRASETYIFDADRLFAAAGIDLPDEGPPEQRESRPEVYKTCAARTPDPCFRQVTHDPACCETLLCDRHLEMVRPSHRCLAIAANSERQARDEWRSIVRNRALVVTHLETLARCLGRYELRVAEAAEWRLRANAEKEREG